MFKFKFLIIIFLLFFAGCNDSSNIDEKTSREENKITDEQIAGSEFNQFLFVGMVNKNPGIYKYDINKEEYSVFWYKRYEKVENLFYSEGRNDAFFITDRNSGRRGVLSFIDNVKIYLINNYTGKVKFLERIGNGIQVLSGWDTKNSFKVSLNFFDKRNSHFVHQRDIIFDITGQKILDETKILDVIKERNEKPAGLELNRSKGNYKIFTTKGDLTSIFLVNLKNNDTTLITTVDQKLNKVSWSKDMNVIIFSTISPYNLKYPDSGTSKLFVYSLENKRILKLFEGDGIKNFFVINNWVIFDDGFNKNSHINIYNYINLEMIKKISMRGGCGLQNLPQISDYTV